ncbi:uncharacterized protein RJT21DRAFT_118541 [Scheffersomyces amazonensis]|uniref:uncharacterized protein n=1 Tax=Scheffersomyces amazonensis TaxID=1078765 RepID=UPI00315C85AA
MVSSLIDLPPELLIQVFQSLSPQDLEDVINVMIDLIGSDDDKIIDLMYVALFSSRLSLTNYNSRDKITIVDRQVIIKDFELILSLQRRRSAIFQRCIPQNITVRFTRKSDDYHTFIQDLQQLHGLFKRKKKGTIELANIDPLVIYFENNFQKFDVVIDCNLQWVENPTSISSSVIQILLDMASNPYLNKKLINLTIKASDIGSFYFDLWSRLLISFENLIYLDLSNNVLQNVHDDIEDILSMSFKFPPNLKILNMSQNLITKITNGFIINLPSSLEVLKLNDNIIVILANDLNLSIHLPKLINLQLNNNPHLDYIQETTFNDIKDKDFRLELRGNNINDDDMNKLKALAKVNRFTLVI